MRFTDEKKWSDKWFRSLKPCHKIVWIYICDSCDIAGFYEVDIESIAFHTKLTEDESKGAIEGLSRGYLGAQGHIWIKNFLKHQNNHILNPLNNCHKGIIKRIQMNLSLFPTIPEILGANEGLFSPTSKSKGNSKGNVEVEVIVDVEDKDQLEQDRIDAKTSSEINVQLMKKVDMDFFQTYLDIFQDIKPYNEVRVRVNVMSSFREACQKITPEQVVQAAKDYREHCEDVPVSSDMRKNVEKFLSEKQYMIDWLIQNLDKGGDLSPRMAKAYKIRSDEEIAKESPFTFSQEYIQIQIKNKREAAQ